MANQRVVDLTADTTPADADLLYVVHDPSGTAANRKVAVSDLRKWAAIAITGGTIIGVPWTSNDQSGTTYTLVAADSGKIVRCTNASAVTLTVPTNASVGFALGTTIAIYAGGAGGVTISPAGGVTIRNNTAGLVQYQEVSLRKDATNEWVRVG